MTLRRLALTTKIPLTALEALERNDVAQLPAGIFGRSFVRAYAREVGLDPERTVEAFISSLPEPASRVFRKGADQIDLASPDGTRRLKAIVAAGLIMSVLVVLFLVAFLFRGDSVPGPESRLGVDVEFGRSGTVGASAPVARPLIVEIHPTADCHVTLTVDGARVLSRLMRAGEREVHEVQDRVVIEAGNAAAFAFSINRQRGQSLGEPGDEVTLVLDRDNYRRFLAR